MTYLDFILIMTVLGTIGVAGLLVTLAHVKKD